MPSPDAEETVTYQFEISKDRWRRWTDTVPRSTPLDQRLRTLVDIDSAFDGDAEVYKLNLLAMKFERIAQRSETAADALEREDRPKVLAELDKIQEIADVFDD